MPAAGAGPCIQSTWDRGKAVAAPFFKSGGFSDRDPDAAFFRAYFRDPLLRLPAGRYEIHAVTDYLGAQCAGPIHTLDASVTIDVLP
jgi:hypothetical protein